jgi:tetratricopeptide (TPR) repeat protein
MELTSVIFVSAVSNEFHKVPLESRHLFPSYRDVVKQAFRVLAKHYEVIVQEDLPLGFDDLLKTLDDEITRSLFVIHLVGDLAGFAPEPAPLRELHARHPDLLDGAPELRDAVGNGLGVTYTQWELYLAFHHKKGHLIFEVQPSAPRSPLFAPPTPADQASQTAHRRRIEVTGAHRSPFENQGDVARKSIRSFLHFRVDLTVDPVEPSKAARDEAWEHPEEIVKYLAEAIKKPDPRAVPVMDPANVAAFVAAVRSAAERWQVNLATILDIAARYEEEIRAVAESRPTPAALYDQALAELALGDYTASRFSTRRAANLALELLETQPLDEPFYREAALNALLLLHEAAKAAHDTPAAIAALEEAGALVDQEADPLLWAEIHESLVHFLLEHAKLDRAHDLISDIIDVREERQGEDHPDLAGTLMLWANLLYARANYSGMKSVAARAGRIYAGQTPPELSGFAKALNAQALALTEESRPAEAEPLYRRALAIDEASFGPDHPKVATELNNLAQLLKATNRLSEAEPLMHRALAIDEASFGPDHPNVATELNNLAQLLQATNRLLEAEPLMRRALAIDEASFGPDHPNVAIRLNNLALLLKATNRLSEAEPLYRRALAIDEASLGPDHPDVAIDLNNLAQLLQATNRLSEAEPLMRRALAIDEAILGPDHPDVAVDLNNLAQLLQDTNRLSEAEPLMRLALAIDEASFGPDHPNVAIRLNNLAQLLQDTNRLSEAEPLMRRALEIYLQFTAATGHEHPHLNMALENYSVFLKEMGRSPAQIRAQLEGIVQSILRF